MVVMSTRRTNISLVEKNKIYGNKIIGIKGDSVVATAKDVLLTKNVIEVLDGAKTMQDAVDKLSELAASAQQQININAVEADKNAKKYALVMG